jgi:hypothetical protein
MNKNENCISEKLLKDSDYEKEISFEIRNIKSATGTHSKNISINTSPVSKKNQNQLYSPKIINFNFINDL